MVTNLKCLLVVIPCWPRLLGASVSVAEAAGLANPRIVVAARLPLSRQEYKQLLAVARRHDVRHTPVNSVHALALVGLALTGVRAEKSTLIL